MIEAPGTARDFRSYLNRDKRRSPDMAQKQEKMQLAVELRADGKSLRDSAQELRVSKSTVERLLFDYDRSQKGSPRGNLGSGDDGTAQSDAT